MCIVRSICCVEFVIICLDSVIDLLALLKVVLGEDVRDEFPSFWNARSASLKVGPSSNSAPPSLILD